VVLSRREPGDAATEQLLFAYDHVFGGGGSNGACSVGGGGSSGGGRGEEEEEEEAEEETDDYAQQAVFEAIGYVALSCAWSGADATILAYGQVACVASGCGVQLPPHAPMHAIESAPLSESSPGYFRSLLRVY
jgi:hypothetical protein